MIASGLKHLFFKRSSSSRVMLTQQPRFYFGVNPAVKVGDKFPSAVVAIVKFED